MTFANPTEMDEPPSCSQCATVLPEAEKRVYVPGSGKFYCFGHEPPRAAFFECPECGADIALGSGHEEDCVRAPKQRAFSDEELMRRTVERINKHDPLAIRISTEHYLWLAGQRAALERIERITWREGDKFKKWLLECRKIASRALSRPHDTQNER